MVEKVGATDEVPGGAGTEEKTPFKAEKVWTCPSCSTVNPASAGACSGCGGKRPTDETTYDQDTQPATCPNCLGERPFAPGWGDSPEQYYGECPHCHQDANEANAAKKKLESGDASEWGKGARH